MELLRLEGEGCQIGDLAADEAEALAGKPAFTIRLPDGRCVVIVGLTRDECRCCVPGFLSLSRLTVSAS